MTCETTGQLRAATIKTASATAPFEVRDAAGNRLPFAVEIRPDRLVLVVGDREAPPTEATN